MKDSLVKQIGTQNKKLEDNEKELLIKAIEQNDNKGDDICDSYLQGFHHIFDGEIPQYYQKSGEKILKVEYYQMIIDDIRNCRKLNEH